MTFTELLENRRIGVAQGGIALVILLALVVDGLDLLLLAFVSPRIIAEWQVDKAHFGIAMSAALVTMAIGAFFGGRAGDRYGRKRILAISVLSFSAATFATSLVHDLTWLTLLRLAGGLGFGAATPNGLALAAEWLPRQARAKVASAVSVASPLGGIVAGFLTLQILPVIGWRGCFGVSGVLAAAIGLVVLLWLPESPAYSIGRGRRDDAMRAIARVFGRGTADTLTLETAVRPDAVAAPLFTRAALRFHVGLSIGFFACSYVTFALSNWVSVLLTTLGLSFADAARGFLAFNVLAVASALLMPPLFQRMGSRATMILAASVTIAMLALIAVTAATVEPEARRWPLWIATGGLGLSQGLLNATFYAVITFGYPPALRASGAGYAMMINRIGGVVAIVTSGVVMTYSAGDPRPFLGGLALMIVLSLAGVLTIDRHVARRPAIERG